MKSNLFASLLFIAMFFVACDTTTDQLGGSLTSSMDNLEITADTFFTSSRSVAAQSVYARISIGYLGQARDPETNSYVTGSYMTQFHVSENYKFPTKSLISSIQNGDIVADSCFIQLYYMNFYGDSLATMKVVAHELERPMTEENKYYTNFNPIEAGFVKSDGYKVESLYNLADTEQQSANNNSGQRIRSIKISLNKPYQDKNGKQYTNYGTYVLQKYYENPDNFANSIKLANHVIPGFYFEHGGGLGSMAYIYMSQLNVYFTFKQDNNNTVGVASFSGTEEVLQTSTITNDANSIDNLIHETEHTYIKAPAGIFTEIDIPVDAITTGHASDSISSVKIDLQVMNNQSNNPYAFTPPTELLLIEKDSLQLFFEKKKIADNRTSFLATYNAKNNSYTFNNIANLVLKMNDNKKSGSIGSDWNKVVIIPVKTTYYTNQNTNILTSVTHDMALSSTKLVGGNNAQRISVIYSHFK